MSAPHRARWRTARRAPIAVAVAVAAVLAACSPDERASVGISSTAPTVTSSAAPDATTAPSAATTAPAPRTVRIGAPPDCPVNPYCAAGLARVYGIDVTGTLVPEARIATSVADLKAGKLDAAVVFSTSPYPLDPELVVLADDDGMIAADAVTLVYRRRFAALYPALPAELDALSARLDQAALRTIGTRLAARVAPATVAADWLATVPTTPTTPPPAAGELLVGAADFLESKALAAVTAGYLTRRGYPARAVELGGMRQVVIDALANGDVAIVPEYAASLLESLDGERREATTDPVATTARLREYLALMGATVGKPAPGIDTNVFVTTPQASARLGLRTLGDLRRFGFPTAEPPPAVDPTAPVQLAGWVKAEQGQLTTGSSGAAVREVQTRLVQLGATLEITGVFDQPTLEAVRRFQSEQGLTPDGVVGPVTERALANPKPKVADPAPVSHGDPGVATKPPAATSAGDKVIYLTFDDGPHPTFTPKVLDLLDRFTAKATFFEVGNQVQNHTKLSAEVLARGHALGNHTWDHKDLAKLSSTAIRDELAQTTGALVSVGAKVTCMRPPYGSSNATVRAQAKTAGLAVHLWDIDPQDWARPGVAAIVDNVLNHAKPGRVVLMHDGGGDRTQTVAALEQVLTRLSAQGYRFERLPGC